MTSHLLLLLSALSAAPAPAAPPEAVLKLDLPVDAGALPPPAFKAWREVLAIAPAAEHYTAEWTRAEPRDEVKATLAAALAVLRAEADRAPRKLELQLAAGITARLAHNLDVDGAAEAGLALLERAVAAAPDDPRPRWQLGMNLCEMGRLPEAMPHLEAAEGRFPGKRPPAAYWGEVQACSHMAMMPAHVLRAAAMLRRQGPLTEPQEFLVGKATELLVRPTPKGELPAEEAYLVEGEGAARRLVSLPCGFAVPVREGQPVRASPVNDGTCMVQLQLGPFPGKNGDVFPFVTVLARPARLGETTDAFLERLAFMKARRPMAPGRCPAGDCQVFEVPMPEAYQPEGGGLATAVVMERADPEFPSVLLERAAILPRSDGEGPRYFRPLPRPTRFAGRIFYLVALDTAQSALAPAREEFRRILDGLLVE